MKTKQKSSLKKIDIYTFGSNKKEEYLEEEDEEEEDLILDWNKT